MDCKRRRRFRDIGNNNAKRTREYVIYSDWPGSRCPTHGKSPPVHSSNPFFARIHCHLDVHH